MASDSKPVIHRGIALMVCENEAILEETLQSIEMSDLQTRRIGDRALVAPAYQLEEIREALQARGTYPKVIGDIVSPEDLVEEDEETDDESADTDEEETE